MNFEDGIMIDDIIEKSIKLIEQTTPPVDAIRSMGLHEYIIEFRTIVLNVPRRVGKSTYINSHANEWDLIVSQFQNRDQWEYRGRRSDVIYINGVNPSRGNKYPTPRIIYFDEVPLKMTRQLSDIFKNYIVNPEQILVFIGTPRMVSSW